MSAIPPSLRAGCIVVLAGPAAARKLTSGSPLHHTALHEAGHCVAGYFLSKPAAGVTIVPDQDAGTAGLTLFSEARVPDDSIPRVIREAASLDDDRKVGALLILNEVGGDGADLIAWFAVLQNEAETLVLRYRRFIEALAARLLDARSLTREEIAETIESVRAEIAHERLCELGLA